MLANEALLGPGVHDADLGEAVPNQPLHLRPAQSASLASALERSIPVPLRYALECVESIAVVGHRVVGRMPSDYARQPLPLFFVELRSAYQLSLPQPNPAHAA